ncbi:MAG: EamA family transporter [Pyrinomonadaceae bacterium]|nr:EamA family transporter [Pyrinomonadaceae bacterium]
METKPGHQSAPNKAAPHFSPLLLVLGAALLWSTGGLFVKWTSLSAFELTFYRSLLAAATVALLTRREGFGINRLTILASVLYAALLLLFVIANKKTTAANAIFLQYTSPIYMLIFEPIFYKEKFRRADLITVLVCIGGMSLFFVGQLKPDDIEGNIAALVSGLCMGFYFLLLRHPRAQEVNRASSVIYGNLLLVAICAPVGLAVIPALGVNDVVAVSYLGIIQIGVAYTLFTLGMARGVRSLDAGIVGYIEPVLNPVWVFIFLKERPSQWAVLGGAIIVSAVVSHMILRARKTRLKI